MIPPDFDWRAPNYGAVWAERAKRLMHLRANPHLIAGVKTFYKDHPVEFINDWLCTFDPRAVDVGLEPVMPFLLFPKQTDFIVWLLERWRGREDGLVEKCRDMGASWLCCAFALWMWLFHPGSVAGFGSRKEEYVDKLGDPKSLFWKIRQAIMLLPEEFRPAGYSERVHAPSMRIANPENGAVIVGEAGDNIGRGNRTSVYFKDESAFYERPDAIDAALSQTSNCKIDVSTPNGAGNPFYRKRMGGRVPVFVFDWRDDPRKGQEWYEKQRRDLDPVILAQEVDRDYTASVSNAFIPGPLVAECQGRGPGDVRAEGPILCGVDVARFGDDKTCITFRRGRVVLLQVVLAQLDVPDVAGRVKDEVMAFRGLVKQIAVDTIGIGSGVADILRRDFRRMVVDVNSARRLADGQNYNLRARMWRDMREWLKNGASLPNDPDLRTDLTALQYEFRGGELLMESKDDAKKRGIKSPDRADSLALTFAFPAIDYAGAGAGPTERAETDYDMFG